MNLREQYYDQVVDTLEKKLHRELDDAETLMLSFAFDTNKDETVLETISVIEARAPVDDAVKMHLARAALSRMKIVESEDDWIVVEYKSRSLEEMCAVFECEALFDEHFNFDENDKVNIRLV